MGVQQQAHDPLLPPSFQFLWRQRFEEFWSYRDLALQGAWLAISAFVLDRDQFHDRLFTARNDDLFPLQGLLDELGELRLSFVNRNGFHRSLRLANLY